MKLIRLQAFKEVIDAGTVTEASRRLKCSQPRISRLISELEEDIGFPLFRREKQRLEPTAEGKLFYQETERILLGIDDIERIAEDIYKQRETCLRILSQSHLAHGLLSHAFGKFENKVKGVRYYLEIRPREELAAWLRGHQFDLAIAPLPAKHPLVRHEQLISVKLLVVFPQGHPFSDKEQVTVNDLANESIIALTKGMIMRQRLDNIFHQSGISPNIRIETPTVLSACQFVSQGLGVTIADPFAVNLFRDSGYIFRPFSPDYKITYGTLFLRQNPPRRLVRQFIETVKEVAIDIAQAADALY